MNVLSQSLWITLISMGLVFAALVLLAGLMAAMTRIFRDREALTPGPSPDYGRGGQALARAGLFCGRVPERAGTMPENEAPSRGPGRCDFVCQFRQFVESRGEGFILVRDQRSAQFEEDEFGHGLTLA